MARNSVFRQPSAPWKRSGIQTAPSYRKWHKWRPKVTEEWAPNPNANGGHLLKDLVMPHFLWSWAGGKGLVRQVMSPRLRSTIGLCASRPIPLHQNPVPA